MRSLQTLRSTFAPVAALMVLGLAALLSGDDGTLPRLQVVRVESTIDGESQPIGVWFPPADGDRPLPLLVSLHSWSADYRQDRTEWLAEAMQRGWGYIQPNFRGVNDHPEACGSPLARQDVLDALDWACRERNIDPQRIYLAGVSGGGHMTMQMAAYHPERFSAASAWVGPTDLAEWYRFHVKNGQPQRYAQMIAACCGGPPGASPEVDAQYRERSPVFHLGNVGELHLDLNTGVKDGVTGSVPIHHTLWAFNTIAGAQGAVGILADEMDHLWKTGRLQNPLASDLKPDPTYGRAILLRRTAGNTRVTVFDGTHEALPSAACAWLAAQRRETKPRPAARPE